MKQKGRGGKKKPVAKRNPQAEKWKKNPPKSPGRKPGVPNKITREWKEILAAGVKDEGRVEAMWARYDREMAARPGTPAPIVALVWQKTFSNPPVELKDDASAVMLELLRGNHREQHERFMAAQIAIASAAKAAMLKEASDEMTPNENDGEEGEPEE